MENAREKHAGSSLEHVDATDNKTMSNLIQIRPQLENGDWSWEWGAVFWDVEAKIILAAARGVKNCRTQMSEAMVVRWALSVSTQY